MTAIGTALLAFRDRRRLGIGVATCVTLMLVPTATAASGQVRTGTATDPVGDVTPPQRDITAVEVTYDPAGTVIEKVTLAAPPDAATGTGVLFGLGTLAGAACENRIVGGGAVMPNGPASAALGSVILNEPTRTLAGNTVTLQVSDGRIANFAWDCARVGTIVPGGGIVEELDLPLTPSGAQPPPAPVPVPPATARSCRITSSKVRRGRSLVVRCTNVTGALSVRFERRGKRTRRISARVDAQGRARLSTRRLPRGRYRVTVSQNRQRLAARTVRVR